MIARGDLDKMARRKIVKKLTKPFRDLKAKDLRKFRNLERTNVRVKPGSISAKYKVSMDNTLARARTSYKAKKRRHKAIIAGVGAYVLGSEVNRFRKRKSKGSEKKKKSYSIRRSRKRDNRRRDRKGRFR